MRILVTGASGFVGRHFSAVARAAGHEIVARGGPGEADGLDLRDAGSVRDVVVAAAPDAVVHLAGQASVPPSIADPLATLEVNAGGTARVLEAVRACAGGVRVLVVGSAEVYGRQRPERMPLDEPTPLRPDNPYAASKEAAEAYALTWSRVYALDVMVSRSFNHIGPGQDERFVVPSFARQIARVAAGGSRVMLVGNLEAQRDFLDVRDVVAAYLALLERGRRGEVYNVCSGRPVAIREILRQLIALARVGVEIRDDPERMRPSDAPVLFGDAAKIRAETGWEPKISLAATLRDVYAEARERVEAVSAVSSAVETFVFARRGELLAIPAVLLVAAGRPSALSVALGLPLAFAGEALRAWAVGYSGVTTRGDTVTAPALVTAGPYAYLRNPLYAGNFLTATGFAVAFTGGNAGRTRTALVAAALGAMTAVYAVIVPHEERFLREQFGIAFDDYVASVPRAIPLLAPAGSQSGTYDPGVIGRAESRTFVTFAAMLAALAWKARAA